MTDDCFNDLFPYEGRITSLFKNRQIFPERGIATIFVFETPARLEQETLSVYQHWLTYFDLEKFRPQELKED